MNPLHKILHRPKGRILATVCLLLFLLAAIGLYQECLSPMKEGIRLSGVEVGGMTPIKARQALETALEESLLQKELAVHLPEETLFLSPEDCGFRIQTGKAIRAARKEDANADISLLPYLKAEETGIIHKLEAYAARYDTQLQQPSWQLEGESPQLSTEVFSPDAPGQVLVVTKGIPSVHLDCKAVLSEILQTAAQAVSLCQNGQYQVTPEVLPEEVPADVDADTIAEEYCRAAVNDTVDRETYQLIYGAYGTQLDRQALAEMIMAKPSGCRSSICRRRFWGRMPTSWMFWVSAKPDTPMMQTEITICRCSVMH